MQSINLQIAPGSVNPVINVSQNDVGRQFQLKLYDGAAAYTLPTGTTASIEGIKPDGHAFSYSDAVSVSGSILTVTTKLQMTVVAGRVICEIRLRKSGLDLGSLNFVMLVEESPINENVDPSDTEIPAIIELAEEQVEDAEAWARGTKNGEPVPSTDPQFQNNAKWYAEHVAASLDALSNVNISSPANEDVFEYDSTTQKWKNSGAVRQLKQALSNEVTTRATHGAHNLMPFPYYNKNGRTNGNILFLVDEDGIITASKIDAGSSTMDGWFNLASATPIAKTALEVGKTYVLSGGTSSNPLFIQFRDSSQQTIGSPISCTGSEVSVTIPNNAACFDSYYHVTNATSPVTLKPIICDEKDAYTEFTPYAMTNRELTDAAIPKNYSISFESGFASDNGDIRVINGICYFNPQIYTNNTLTSGTQVTVGVLPEGCRPIKVIRIVSYEPTPATLLGVLKIAKDGTITYTPSSTEKYFGYVNAAFPVQ